MQNFYSDMNPFLIIKYITYENLEWTDHYKEETNLLAASWK